MRLPLGFKFAGVSAGIKANRPDLALLVSEIPAVTAGVFTVNRLCAAPVRHGMNALPSDAMRAIVANSGNANAMTGAAGAEDERAMAGAVAAALGVTAIEVLTASTGGIGIRLPVHKIADAAPALVEALGEDEAAFRAAANAIRTTDLTTKLGTRELQVGGKTVTIAAICKGSGMIHPQMATMLCFVVTDASVSPATLQTALQSAVDESFNTITVDGDMSTNDAVIAMANGRAGAPLIEVGSPDFDRFAAELQSLCTELARRIAADGEGATKLLIVDIVGAPGRDMARDLARAVAGGSLVKAGVFGGDPSMGRILAALGARAGARDYAVDLARLSLVIQGTLVYDARGPLTLEAGARDELNTRMKEKEITVGLDLAAGDRSARAMGCDLSYDYVRINADYAGAMAAGPGAPSGAIDGGNGGGINRGLIVGALSYIRKFAGRRAVIKYGGAAMVDPDLKRSFAEEVVLLQAAGLRPIVVHGGGPEITRTLNQLGHKTTFADGQRVTSAADMNVVEMVLTGRVNTEIVGLLSSLGGKAVGLSGKDGRLLGAHKMPARAGKPDLGFVGEIEAVNPEVLELLLDKGFIPVVSPVGSGEGGESYNINADVAAAEIAVATKAFKLIFLTDVAGVLDNDGKLISSITAAELETRMAAEGSGIKGGMMVKTQGVLRALRGGVQSVHIVDGRAAHSIVAELFTDKGVGTLVTA